MKASKGISRRKFIAQTACGAGLAGAWATYGTAAVDSRENAFAYDVDKYARTDPKLLGYNEGARFSAGVPEPRRIAVTANGQVLVAGKTGVAVLEPAGRKLAEFPVANARCVASAQDGTIYVGARDHIEVFDAKGSRLSVWDKPAGKTWLSGLAVGENDVFAADSAARMILRYDRSGKLVGRIGEKNKDRNVPGFIVPSPYLDVELAADGLLRVNNPGRHRVEAYTAAGDFELAWGKPSAAIAGFCGCCNPIGLALLPEGRWVTCEKGLPRVKVYSPEGNFECVVAGPESFPQNAKSGSTHDLSDGSMGGLDAAADRAGIVYVLDLVTGDVRVMKPKTQV